MPMIRGSTLVVTTVAGNQELIGPNEKRCAIAFLGSSAQTGTIDVNNRPTAAAGDGYAISKQSPVHQFTIDYYGDLVKGPWSAWASANGDKLMVVEAVYV